MSAPIKLNLEFEFEDQQQLLAILMQHTRPKVVLSTGQQVVPLEPPKPPEVPQQITPEELHDSLVRAYTPAEPVATPKMEHIYKSMNDQMRMRIREHVGRNFVATTGRVSKVYINAPTLMTIGYYGFPDEWISRVEELIKKGDSFSTAQVWQYRQAQGNYGAAFNAYMKLRTDVQVERFGNRYMFIPGAKESQGAA